MILSSAASTPPLIFATRSYGSLKKTEISGNLYNYQINNPHVERMNLNIRMGNRRVTCLTNAFSKTVDNHLHMLSLYFVHSNFCRMQKSLRMSPAMAAGVSDTLCYMDWVVGLIDARAPKPGPRGPYKKRRG